MEPDPRRLRRGGVRFAFEVAPTEIAYDIFSAERALAAMDRREAVGFNLDPSQLYWQFVDPARFVDRFADRIYHMLMKDAVGTLDGESGILSPLLRGPPRGVGLPFGRARGRGLRGGDQSSQPHRL